MICLLPWVYHCNPLGAKWKSDRSSRSTMNGMRMYTLAISAPDDWNRGSCCWNAGDHLLSQDSAQDNVRKSCKPHIVLSHCIAPKQYTWSISCVLEGYIRSCRQLNQALQHALQKADDALNVSSQPESQRQWLF